MAGPFDPYYIDDGGGKAITAITKSNPCKVTVVGHSFDEGDRVSFHNIGGMTELNFVNGSSGYYISGIVDLDNFNISVDSSSYGTYTSGGTAHTGRSWSSSFLSFSEFDDVIDILEGATVYIGHNHVCPYVHTTNRIITGPGNFPPIKIISVTQGSDPPTYQIGTTNQIDTTEGAYTIDFNGCFHLYGVRIASGNHILFTTDANEFAYVDDCYFLPGANGYVQLSTDASGGSGKFTNIIIDCTADASTARNNPILSANGSLEVHDLTAINCSNRSNLLSSQHLSIFGADLTECSKSGNLLFGNGTVVTPVIASNLLLHPNTSVYAGSTIYPNSYINIVNYGIENNPIALYYTNNLGTVISNKNIYRLEGASIESINFSWLITTKSICYEQSPFCLPWIYGFIDILGFRTFSVCITNDSSNLSNNAFWLELEHLKTIDEAQWTLVSSHRVITESLQYYENDTTSVWYGSGPSFTYKQKLSVTASIAEVGQYRVRVIVGSADISSSSYFYIDPKVIIT